MNNATNKTNEEAADLLEKHLDFFAGTTQWVFTLAIAALRSTPPATGAAAMREAAAVVADGFCGDRPSRDDYTFGRYCAADEIAQAIRALPAPEVPEAVQQWCAQFDHGRLMLPNERLRVCLRKEYGL